MILSEGRQMLIIGFLIGLFIVMTLYIVFRKFFDRVRAVALLKNADKEHDGWLHQNCDTMELRAIDRVAFEPGDMDEYDRAIILRVADRAPESIAYALRKVVARGNK